MMLNEERSQVEEH